MPYLTGIAERTESSTTTTGTAYVPLMPHRAGDIIVLVLEHRQPAEAVNVDVAGYTKKLDQENGDQSMQVWWRRAAADDEAAPVITNTFGNGLQGWQPLKISGAAASGDPFDVTAVGNQASSTTHTCPTVTTTVDDCGILTVVTTGANPSFTVWANSATSPRMVAKGITVFGGLIVANGWGHMPTAGVVGTTTLTSTGAVASTVATLAVKPGPVDLAGAATWRDSIFSSEPATLATITLPTYQSDDLLVGIVSGSSEAKTVATTLSGFTKLKDLPARNGGRPSSVFTQRASGATTDPVITHTFSSEDWTLTIFAVSGYLSAWSWELGTASVTVHTGVQHVETPTGGKVAAYLTAQATVTTTSCLFDVATGEAEQEDGGPNTCRVALYNADSDTGWLGAPEWTISSAGNAQWVSMTFSDAPVPATVTPTVTARSFTVPTSTVVVGVSAASGGGEDENRMGGAGAVRHHPVTR